MNPAVQVGKARRLLGTDIMFHRALFVISLTRCWPQPEHKCRNAIISPSTTVFLLEDSDHHPEMLLFIQQKGSILLL